MSNPATEQSEQDRSRSAPSGSESWEVASREQGSVAASGHGVTTIADVVVQKIASMAAREVSGVRDLGGEVGRAFGALRERIPGAQSTSRQGVTVEVGERQAAIDLEVLVDYGVAIPDLARSVRKNVIFAIERMTGLDVVEVNFHVNDIYTSDGDEGTSTQHTSRVE